MRLRRLYIHNFRCLENFDLLLADHSSVLLVGKNGMGKTTTGLALGILQKIARGTNRISSLLSESDMTRGHTDVPVRFIIELEHEQAVYEYVLALEFPEGFKELRVLEERLSVNDKPAFTRNGAEVTIFKAGKELQAKFKIDWHLVALPIVDSKSITDIRQQMARMLILSPVPDRITGESDMETLEPNRDASNFGAWFSGLLAYAPAAYAKIDSYLRRVMPDFKDIKNPLVGSSARRLEVQFSNQLGTLRVPFKDLSDGEKCFMICALVLAANEAYGPVVCFWDEPDNYLALSEVADFILALRGTFERGGQFIATSHNSEAIRSFSRDNTIALHRESHLEPTVVRPLKDLPFDGDLVAAMARGDLPWQ